MDIATEIRKLPRKNTFELVQILEYGDSWKRLMAIIPKILNKTNYQCDITLNNLHKYRSEHFNLIESYSSKLKKSCTDILLDEWGTSGYVRPTLGHLLYLLIKAELFRAADYVAIELLKQSPPKRPDNGPPAQVVLNEKEIEEVKIDNIEQLLDEINYPSSAIENILRNSINKNINRKSGTEKIVPKIIISELPSDSEINLQVPLVLPKQQQQDSDLIKFSSSSVESEHNVPVLSTLLKSEKESISSISESSSSNNAPNLSDESSNLPNFSLINTNMSSSSSLLSNESNNSRILNCSNHNVPNLSKLIEQSECNIPVISQLINRSCSSPLPNLSLNTLLPHFNYNEIEKATNNFDETKLSDNGRYLGGGAFGKVFLAKDLLDNRLVAVKKLILHNVEIVNIDDTITKQFRYEVEILSKYKHENLLSLLGYSCDGFTYCLLYEYMEGGALKDRLQSKDNILSCMERLHIALGTARAISYLHTGFSTPLIHRDIKTANILLDKSNQPKLCDFGLIKLLPNQNTSTATTIFGTSAYMAPEAFRGDISVKLDTFSFGVVLLELLTSLPPLDENREGHDLVTYIEDNCEDNIDLLLDKNGGNWWINGINIANELYKYAKHCLEEKKKRPQLSEITIQLDDLMRKLFVSI